MTKKEHSGTDLSNKLEIAKEEAIGTWINDKQGIYFGSIHTYKEKREIAKQYIEKYLDVLIGKVNKPLKHDDACIDHNIDRELPECICN